MLVTGRSRPRLLPLLRRYLLLQRPRPLLLAPRWLLRQRRPRPRLVLAVGQLALARFLPGRPLEQLVGRGFDGAGVELDWPPRPDRPRPWILPLPHPSGASRWLNQAANRELLALALERLGALLAAERAPGPGSPPSPPAPPAVRSRGQGTPCS